jgi:uncharacterized protein (TIGR02588 family)
MARRRTTAGKTPALEWIAAGFGALVALIVIGTIGWQAVTARHDPVPLLSAGVETVTAAGSGYVVTVRVTNASSRTAASVHVEGEIAGEVSTATVDYVPGHGEASAGLLVAADPRTSPLALRVTGYEHP